MNQATDQLLFALEFAMDGKREIVSEMGIGSDLFPVIVGFSEDGSAFGFAQLSKAFKNMAENYQRIESACSLMVSGWRCSSIGIVAEGYTAKRLEDDEQRGTVTVSSLARRFAQGDANVTECLTGVWGSTSGACQIGMIPYQIKLGRKVEWLIDDFICIDNARPYGDFADMIMRVFDERYNQSSAAAMLPEVHALNAAAQIMELGFFVECDIPGGTMEWMNDN